MFRCENCQTVTQPYELSHRLVAESRPVSYPFRADANVYRADKKEQLRDDRGGSGFEIVRELTVCTVCSEKIGAVGGVSR